MLADFKVEVNQNCLKGFCDSYFLKTLAKLTFQNSYTTETVLLIFHEIWKTVTQNSTTDEP